MRPGKETLDKIALSEAEYELIVNRLGREPTEVELGMFGALWSEHCGYKHSKLLLSMFPSRSKLVPVKPGEENAGVVDIGDGQCIVMKIESHNHPSAIEPFQGAATGVGGIVRDIFTMGARPIALLNSLRFGPLTDPHNKYLFNGVVGGIASYGNCLGIPDVAGEIYFSRSYSANPLVNAMCVGIGEIGGLIKAGASGVGNLLMLVGADTGRDGLHGASGLASRTFEQEKELRSTVQVGNPFMEKLLMEACLELAKKDWITGMQDLGAAGLTSSSLESAYKAGTGIEIDVLKIPRREEGMTPYEVMLSESQERMLIIVKKGFEQKVKALFDRWDLRSDVIGFVTDDGQVRIKEGERVVADAPIQLFAEPPLYKYKVKKPSWLKKLHRLDTLPEPKKKDCSDILISLLSSPNIASKEWVYRQYDHQVMDNTVVLPGSDCAVLRIQGNKKAITLSVDGNGKYCYLDPYRGGMIAVAEAARNVVCGGAKPLALTNCLNFGNPEKKDVYYQLKECIRGIAHACRVLKIPVISGNVSLYNETRGQSVYPTPVIGMLGLMQDVGKHCTAGFKNEGDLVYIIGDISSPALSDLSGSEFLEVVHGKVTGRPVIDIAAEKLVQKFCLQAINRTLLKSAHDCSEGGLLVCLAESCILGGVGFDGNTWEFDGRLDALLFGERAARLIVSVSPIREREFQGLLFKYNILYRLLGRVGGERVSVKGLLDLSLQEVEAAWKGGLGRALGVAQSV